MTTIATPNEISELLVPAVREATTIEALAGARTAGFAQLEDARSDINQAFADGVRAAIAADPDENVTTAAKRAGLSRQVMHDLLRRYPAAA